MKESQIEKILVDKVREQGGRAYKFVSPGNDGVPDRIVIFPNKAPVFVELKTETGKLRPLQRAQLKRLDDLGQKTDVVYGIKGLAEFFQSQGFPEVKDELERRSCE